MFLISHRGNILGPNKRDENRPDYVEHAMLDKGFDVEVDVWMVGNRYYLGHDAPTHMVNWSFLEDERLWCHAKNTEALFGLLEMGLHCFFHGKDDVTLTSRGFLWTYPGKKLSRLSIAVMPESFVNGADWIKDRDMAGVCSDYVGLLCN